MIETERLHLRPFTIDDADSAYRLNLDPEVIKMTGDSSFESVRVLVFESLILLCVDLFAWVGCWDY